MVMKKQEDKSMFDLGKCVQCGECLATCQWNDLDQESGAVAMAKMINGETTAALESCITCYACNEYCPNHANPFDLFAHLQEQHRLLLSPEDVQAQEKTYLFTGELADFPTGHKRIMTTCVFGRSEADFIQGPLYNLPTVSGKPYFCWIMFSHMGAESIQQKHAARLVKRLAMTGAEEVVCFHDDCYAMLAERAPGYGIEVPFKPIHLAQHVVEYLEAHRSKIRPLNRKLLVR